MLALRRLGWSYMALSDKYHAPKTTIRYLCRKFGLHENTVKVLVFRQDSRTTMRGRPVFYNERNEMINPGKTYAEYLQDEKDRKWQRLVKSHTPVVK